MSPSGGGDEGGGGALARREAAPVLDRWRAGMHRCQGICASALWTRKGSALPSHLKCWRETLVTATNQGPDSWYPLPRRPGHAAQMSVVSVLCT
jgi:hypothetical protein